MPSYRSVVQKLEKWTDYVGVSLIVIMMFLISIDVGKRAIGGGSLTGAYETVELLMVGAVYLGLAYTQSRRGHVKMDVLTSKLPPRVSLCLGIMASLISLALWGGITYEAVLQTQSAIQMKLTTAGLLPISIWPAEVAILLGGFVFCLRVCLDIFDHTRLLASPKTIAEETGPKEHIGLE